MTKSLIPLIPLIIIIISLIFLLIKITIKRDNISSLIITIIGFIFTIISLFYIQNNNFFINNLFLQDKYSIFYKIILLFNNIIVCLLAYKWLSIIRYNKDEFYLLIIISTIGSLVLLDSNNLISMLVGIELISIPIFGLIFYNLKLKYALEASIKYTILSMLVSSFLILGISFIYLDNGSLHFVNLLNSDIIHNFFSINYLTIIGLLLIIISLGFKLSIVPFHLWTPDVYQGSPTVVTLFLTTFSKLSIFIFLFKFLINFAYINYMQSFILQIIILLSILSILFGNIMGMISKNNIKRLLAYSSIAHMGYMFVILIYNQKYETHIFSLEIMIIYIIGYLINNLGILGVMSIFASLNIDEINIDKLYYYRGLFWYDPILTFILTIMLLSLAGVPITIGFISKFYLIALCIKMKMWYLTYIIIFGSSMGIYYYLNIIISLYLKPSKMNKNFYLFKIKNNHYYFFIKNLLLLFAILTIILGLYPEFLIKLIIN
ncbi:NADH-quinone oxidoreductase subunit N [Enterobacteriaceae endosymbiont of Donacia cincticornis]|uniref:NADH-quinone oxidoreductase subunit N n=1 Tax=Enterobacteriaceae endosymbiont of Donacia cincticornis TaxID=2675773 RepID=UPI001449A251|nr:NADH-quinone oxidoreductase subunit N [Enterobacteriaceae endosymbiont of Donacia cincticornis]QJC36230.1 NADH-quinone oxidoreductase subunit N [Enterobacteriaceae endosymbiont of Donacia cincticornis]